MKTYAYARVSARDQNLSRQLDSFSNFGIIPQNIFSEKKSGKDFSRQEYLKLISVLQKGDFRFQKLDRFECSFSSHDEVNDAFIELLVFFL